MTFNLESVEENSITIPNVRGFNNVGKFLLLPEQDTNITLNLFSFL